MSDLPDGWEWSTLDELTEPDRPICYGILMPKDNDPDGIPYVRVKDFPNERIEVESLKRTAPSIAEKYKRSSLRPNDVLVSIRGTYGRVALVPPELDGGNVTQDTARVAPASGVDRDFVAHYLRSAQAQSYFKTVARGVAVKGVNIGDLKKLPVPLAPLAEQQRIVAAVEAHLSRLDGARAALDRVRRRLSRFEELVYSEALVTGPRRRLGEVVRTASGGTPKRSREDFYGGAIPWIKSGELGDRLVVETEETITEPGLRGSSAKPVPEGTVLIAMYGATIGRLGRVGVPMATTNQAVAALYPSEGLTPEFLWNVLRALRSDLIRLGQGGAQPNISQTILRELEIPVPSRNEQAAINAKIDRAASVWRSLAHQVQTALDRSAALRRSILNAAFAGVLVPHDPADEPASVLLGRIQADRAAAVRSPRKRKVPAS